LPRRTVTKQTMNTQISLLLLASCLVLHISASPKRVLDPELSTEEHFGSDHEHNPEYDHEAFVGKDQARQFEELTPEESKERLGKLFHKVDKDGDGKVTEDELKDWIKFTQKKYVWDDSEKQMKQSDENKDGFITWTEYKNTTYGFMDEEKDEDPEAASSYKDMVARDQRRFNKADKNTDGKLNADEFTGFLHPESDDDMKGIVVEETLEDIDKDKDGKISLDEYLGDLWPEEERQAGAEPDWVKSEREQFNEFRDTNKDGFMDKDETAHWIMPDDFDHVTSEAKHLISESDADNDGKVTKEEMVEKFDLFVGSQATDFGEALKHDPAEL